MGLDSPTMVSMFGGPRTAAVLGIALIVSTIVVPAVVIAAPGCSVRYTVGANWGNGFQAQLAITPGAAVTPPQNYISAVPMITQIDND